MRCREEMYVARSSKTAVPWPRTLSAVKMQPTSAGSEEDVMRRHMWSFAWPGVCRAVISRKLESLELPTANFCPSVMS